jgi:hypothetical protein
MHQLRLHEKYCDGRHLLRLQRYVAVPAGGYVPEDDKPIAETVPTKKAISNTLRILSVTWTDLPYFVFAT